MKKLISLVSVFLLVFWCMNVCADDTRAVTSFADLVAEENAASEKTERIAVQVGDYRYTTEEVQAYITESWLDMQFTMGTDSVTVFDSAEEAIREAAEHFVTLAVVDDKLKQEKLDKITEEEEQALRDFARTNYDELWEKMNEMMKEYYPNLEYTEAYVTETLEMAGYSMDALYDKALRELKQQRLCEVYCRDIDMTDEEALEMFRQQYIEPARERYENNVPLFEEEILFARENAYYIPEGYFYIKYIMLLPGQEISRQLAVTGETLQVKKKAAEECRQELTRAALADEDTTEAREACLKADQEAEGAQYAYDEAVKAAETEYAGLANQVWTELNTGSTFEQLIDRYSVESVMTSQDDPGFPFHPDSESWSQREHDAISALKKYRDITEPIYYDGMVYIICRMDDLITGAYEPNAEELTTLKESLIAVERSVALDELVQEWRKDYEITMDLTGLEWPEG